MFDGCLYYSTGMTEPQVIGQFQGPSLDNHYHHRKLLAKMHDISIIILANSYEYRFEKGLLNLILNEAGQIPIVFALTPCQALQEKVKTRCRVFVGTEEDRMPCVGSITLPTYQGSL